MRTLKLLRATVAFVLLLFVSISCRQTENTIKIPAGGTEFMEWMPKNLTTSTFRNGDSIPEVKVDKEWFEAAKEGRPAWCYYNNDPANGKTYGKLYNWYAVNDARGLAPKGWHIPTDKEWQILVDYLGGKAVAGGKMKEKGTSHWSSPNTGATNKISFSALPGGGRSKFGLWQNMGYSATFWSSSKSNRNGALARQLWFNESEVARRNLLKDHGLSVRCVRD